MSFLVLYIIISAIIYVVFRLFKTYQVQTFQAIIINYFVCATMGVFFTGASEINEQLQLAKPALPYAIILGALFISVFTLIGKTTHYFGVAITSISDKLSMIIPVVFALIVYGEPITAFKIVGVLLSIVAVFLAVQTPKQVTHINNRERANHFYVPILVFIGAGVISILLNEVQRIFTEINFNTFLILLFGVAFLLGFLVFLTQLLQGKTKFQTKSIIAGLALGIPNYASMVTLLNALKTSNLESSVIFPVMNIGIVVLASLIGILGFKETTTKTNQLGLLLSVVAIALLLIEQLNG